MANVNIEKQDIRVDVICNEEMLDKLVSDLQALREGRQNLYRLQWNNPSGKILLTFSTLQRMTFATQETPSTPPSSGTGTGTKASN